MNLPQLLLRATSIGGRVFEEASKIDPYQSLQYHRTREQAFKQRNYENWQEGIDLLEQFLLMNREVGEDFAQQYIENNEISEDYQFKALLFLHARACLTSHEILTQIKGGFADGAYARWRNLYETAATALFIKQEGDAGERFLDYRYIEDYHRAQTQQEYVENGKLDIKSATEEEMQILKDKRDEMVDKYGSNFVDGRRGYGWASKYFNNPHFLAIAEETEIEHLKPYYELTHKLIHSGSTSATYRMGRIQRQNIDHRSIDGDDLLEVYRRMTYPASYGFADTAQNTAISLSQVSTALLTFQLTPLRLVKLQALQKMVDDIAEAFVETQLAIKKEEAAKQ